MDFAECAFGPSARGVASRHRERFPLRAGWPFAKHRTCVAAALGGPHRLFARRPKSASRRVCSPRPDTPTVMSLRFPNRACHNHQAAFVVLGTSNALSNRNCGLRRCRRLALGARQSGVRRIGCFRQSGRSELGRGGYEHRSHHIRDLQDGGLSAPCRRGALAFRHYFCRGPGRRVHGQPGWRHSSFRPVVRPDKRIGISRRLVRRLSGSRARLGHVSGGQSAGGPDGRTLRPVFWRRAQPRFALLVSWLGSPAKVGLPGGSGLIDPADDRIDRRRK